MKKLAILAGVLAVLVCGTGAWAALISIGFDDLSAGPDSSRYDGTHVSNQYAALGVTWLGDTHTVTAGYTGQVVVNSTDWAWLNGNALWYYGSGGSGKTPIDSSIALSFSADSFSFEYRRPNAEAPLSVELLYNGSSVQAFNLTAGPAWQTFTYTATGSSGLFNTVRLYNGDKTITDNYRFDSVESAPVPLPPSILLLASALGGFGFALRKRVRG
jgi:hypothetical protein